MDEEELKLGQDIVLREKETFNDLITALPQKAQLGFSGLKEKFYQRNDAVLKELQKNEKQNGPLRLEYTCINATEKILVLGCNLGIIFIYNRILKAITKFTCEVKVFYNVFIHEVVFFLFACFLVKSFWIVLISVVSSEIIAIFRF